MTIEVSMSATGVDLTTPVGRTFDEYDEGYRDMTLGEAVAERISREIMKDDAYPTLRQKCLEIRDEVIREQLAPIVEAAITGLTQRTNQWGEPAGAPTSLRDVIVAEVKAYLQRPAEQYNRERVTLVEKFVRDAVDKAIKKELAAVILDEKTKVVAAVRAKAADIIAQAVREGIGQ